MKIEIKKNVKIVDIEAKLDLTYYRKRKDYSNLLQKISDGEKLDKIFPENIANAIKKRLIAFGLIDSGDALTELGRQRILNPDFIENESGTYGLKLLEFDLDSNLLKMVPKLERKLSADDYEFKGYSLEGIEDGYQCILEDEIVIYSKIVKSGQSTNVYVNSEERNDVVVFDLLSHKFIFADNNLNTGKNLHNKLIIYSQNLLNSNPYGEYDFQTNSFLLTKDLNKLTDEEIIDGEIKNYKINDLYMSGIKFIIDDLKSAQQYFYFKAYKLLSGDSYFNINDLNEMYLNEIFPSGIISSRIQSKLYDFEYKMSGFKEYLPSEKYAQLEYKLHVMEFLLGYKIIENDFSKAMDFQELAEIFESKISRKDVNNFIVVMGYPFAKNTKNRFIEFIKVFSSVYNNTRIVKKGNNQTEDENISDEVKSLSIPVVGYDALKDYYHDRYLIFKLKNNSYKVFLVTCEIDRYFGANPRDKAGMIIEIKPNSIKKNNPKIDLLTIIEKELSYE